MTESVTVRVPATSANLGPGFDCLGLALTLTADITLASRPGPSEGPTAPLGGIGTHPLAPMVLAAARAAYRKAGRSERPGLAVRWRGHLPIARGLGASATARAGGLVGANALMGEPLTASDLLALGAELEGHADNMAPALFGGLQVTVREDEGWRSASVPLPADLKLVLFVPDFAMPTKESRRRLPKRVAREDAVFNAGRAALLIAALAQERWELLDAATQDRLHQPARAAIFPALYDIFDAAKQAGAHAAYLSGGGSTVAALATVGERRIARHMRDAGKARGYSGSTLVTRPSAEGAQVLVS